MTEQEYKELLAIRDGAPDGATHYSIDGTYWKTNGDDEIAWWSKYERWSFSGIEEVTRSLSDINKLIEMYEQQNQIKADAVSDFCFAWRNSRDVGFTEFSSKYIDKLERGEV